MQIFIAILPENYFYGTLWQRPIGMSWCPDI